MKVKPLKYLKSLNWNKEDVKKILMFVIMLLIACVILNNFLLIKIKIIQGRRDRLKIDGSIYTDTSVSGSINADVSGLISTDVSGNIDVDNKDFTGFKIRQ